MFSSSVSFTSTITRSFSRSYEDLGYPGQYFNDRLVEVIDHLLQTPDLRGPIELKQGRVFYEYADPALESRSAGQKLLMRMGGDNRDRHQEEAARAAHLRDDFPGCAGWRMTLPLRPAPAPAPRADREAGYRAGGPARAMIRSLHEAAANAATRCHDRCAGRFARRQVKPLPC